MAKEKIQGWSDSLGCFQEGKKPEEVYCSFDAATLIVHEGDKHERVFTESEVRAMLKDYNAAIYDPGRFARRRLGEPLPQWTEAAQTAALAKHGVSLDPA